MTVERIQLRRGSASDWSTSNPILGDGELGVELGSPIKFKIGDGSSNWNALPYFVDADSIPGVDLSGYIELSQKASANGVATLDANSRIPISQLGNLIDSAPSTLDTLNELATALGDDPEFATTILTALSDKSDLGHTHTKSEITDFTHTHTKSEITDFTHTHTKSQITDFAHSHDASEITNTVSTITATTYALQSSDNGKTLVLNPTGGTISFTINNVFSVGQRVDVYLQGTVANFIQGTGTVQSAGLSMSTQYTVASIICIASGVYALVGNLE